MFSSIESFYKCFNREPPVFMKYRTFYYHVSDSLDTVVTRSRSFRGAGVFLGEDTGEGFVPSLCAVELLEDVDSVVITREEAWWFTNHTVVEKDTEDDGYVVVLYNDMVLGVGRFDGSVLVPVFDVGYYLRSGY